MSKRTHWFLYGIVAIPVGVGLAVPSHYWTGIEATSPIWSNEASPAIATEQSTPDRVTPDPDTPAEDEWEMVGGGKFRKSANCRVETHTMPDGSISEGVMCDDPPRPRHRYADIDIDTLLDMAYRDSEAAEIVAIKLGERGDLQEGAQYAYRAVALHARTSTRALSRFHNTFYSGFQALDEATGVMVFDTESVSFRYVMDRIKDGLSGIDRSADSYPKRALIERAGFTGADIAKLDAQAAEALEYMAQVEIEVVGNNSIKKRINA